MSGTVATLCKALCSLRTATATQAPSGGIRGQVQQQVQQQVQHQTQRQVQQQVQQQWQQQLQHQTQRQVQQQVQQQLQTRKPLWGTLSSPLSGGSTAGSTGFGVAAGLRAMAGVGSASSGAGFGVAAGLAGLRAARGGGSTASGAGVAAGLAGLRAARGGGSTASGTGFGVTAGLRGMSGGAALPADAQGAVIRKARKVSVWVGGLAGVLGSMVGVGGGVLISPVIASYCKALPQRVIAGSSLAAVLATGCASGAVFFSHGSADVTAALLLGVPALLLAPLGAKATHAFDCNKLRYAMGMWLYMAAPLVPLKAALFGGALPGLVQASEATAAAAAGGVGSAASASGAAAAAGAGTAAAFAGAASGAAAGAGAAGGAGAAMAAVTAAATVVAAGESLEPSASSASSPAPSSPTPSTPATPATPATPSTPSASPSWLSSLSLRPVVPGDVVLVITGAAAGFASGLLGIGGGSLVTPALALFTTMPQAQVVGTSLVAMVLPGAAGLISHARLGNVDTLLALGLGAGTLGGALLGSSFALQAPPMVLEGLFAVVMAALGHRTLAALRKK